MPARIDHKNGQRFGFLKIIKRSTKRCGFWICKCDCGTIKEVYGAHFRNGSTSSCGCLKDMIENIKGEKFGYLVVRKYLYSENQHHYWECICVCGEKIILPANNLKRGNTKSCGCMSNKFQEETNMKKYGTKSSFQNSGVRAKFVKNNIKKYGVEYPAQDPEIALKTAKAQKNSYILYHWKTNSEIVCTAGYEKAVVEYLNENKIDFRWQHKVFHMRLSSGKKNNLSPRFVYS